MQMFCFLFFFFSTDSQGIIPFKYLLTNMKALKDCPSTLFIVLFGIANIFPLTFDDHE